MATLPTPTTSLTDVRVRYTLSSGEIFQEFRINADAAVQLTDTEFESLLASMDSGVLTHTTEAGQIRRWVDYTFSGSAGSNIVIRAS